MFSQLEDFNAGYLHVFPASSVLNCSHDFHWHQIVKNIVIFLLTFISIIMLVS